MKKIYFLLFLASLTVFSQTPVIDNTFAASYDSSYSQYIGEYCAPAPNGKLWTLYKPGTDIPQIRRLYSDGKIDNTYTPIDVPGVNRITSRNDGSFVAWNWFSSSTQFYVFNSDGVLNTGFTAPTITSGVNNIINNMIFQDDGKIVLIGVFSAVNGISRSCIVRLNANGSVDTGFIAVNGGFGGIPWCIKPYGTDKYVVAGGFTTFCGTPKYKILRLNNDGTIDDTFNVATSYNQFGIINGFYEELKEIAVQPDGKIITNGTPLYANSNPTTGYTTRLNSNGTKDTSFLNSINFNNQEITVLSDGKIFDGYRRYNTNGSTDTTVFTAPHGMSGPAMGNFYSYFFFNSKIYFNSNYLNTTTGQTRLLIHRKNIDGVFDPTFNPSYGFNTTFHERLYGVNYSGITPQYKLKHKVLSDGKIIIVGNFTTYNDQPAKRLVRLLYNGELDTSFTVDPSTTLMLESFNQTIDFYFNFEEQADGKLIILCGYPSQGYIKRLNTNGSLDNTFSIDQSITQLQPLNDGKFLAYGTGSIFTQSSTTKKIVRLNADGSVDTTFNCPFYTIPNTTKLYFKVLSDNKILIAREGSSSSVIARLNNNGSIDTAFQYPPTSSGIDLYNMFEISGGKYLLHIKPGTTSSLQPRLRRLNANGSIDTAFTEVLCYTFNPQYILNSGHIVFTNPNWETSSYGNTLDIANKILIANSDGTLNNTFANKTAYVGLQDCNKIVHVGPYLNVDAHPANCVTRFNLDALQPVAPPTGASTQTFTNGQTLSNLILNGQNITWYTNQNSCLLNPYDKNSSVNVTNSVLPNSTPLVDGVIYYASQTVSGTESFYRLPIKATQQLSVNENEFDTTLVYYPNPVTNYLTVKSNESISKYEIISLLGSVIESKNNTSQEAIIDFSGYSTGIYLVKVHSENNIKTLKIIKE